MGVNKPNGIEQTKNKSNGKYNSILGSILQIPLPENLETTGLAIVVHHGETDGNLGKNAMNGKSKLEPLNQKGKEEIFEIARILKERIPEGDIARIRIHVNDEVLRNKETAEIIIKELGISPNQIIFSEDLRSQDKVYDENHKLIRQEYFSSSDHEGKSESIPKLRSMAADYVAKTVGNNPDLIHIFVTNRVSYKGFENRADKDLNAIHDYKLKTGIMRIVPINKDGKPLNYIDQNLPIKEQENKIKSELYTLASQIKLEDIDELSDNAFDGNNWLRLRFLDFCKLGVEKKYSNILTHIFSQYPNLFLKTIKILLQDINDEKGKEILDSIIQKYISKSDISEISSEQLLSLLNILYEMKNKYWKELFRKIFLYDNSLLLNNEIMSNSDVSEFYETLQKQSENNKEYQSNTVPVFLGEVEWDKFFVPVIMEKNGEMISVDSLVKDIVDTDENVFLIQGGAGSGKTILTKYLAKELGKVGNNWVKMIDLNSLEKFSLEEFTKDIPSDFDGNIIIILDGLDEKNRLKVDQLLKYLQDKKSDNVKYVCSSRFFPTDSLSDGDKLKSKIYGIKDMDNPQSNEIIKKYTEKLDDNLKEEFETKVNYILQKIGDANHSPLIITMIISIVQDYLCNDEYYEILDQDDIKLSDIYDTFVKFLHNRENNKKDKDKYRTKSENIFMSQRYNDLRIGFLKYLSLCGEGYFNQGVPKKNNNIIEVYDKQWLNHLFLHWVKQKRKDLNIDYKLGDDFIDSLVNYGFLQIESKNQNQLNQLGTADMIALILDLPSFFNVVDNYFFPHKTFQEYFGYKTLNDLENGGESDILYLLSDKLLRVYRNKNDDKKAIFVEHCANAILAYSFNDKYKAFNILGKIKNELINKRGADLRYYDGILNNIIRRVLNEITIGDERENLTYNHISNIVKLGDKFAPNLLEYIKDNLDFYVQIKPGDKEKVDKIKYKLDNPNKFGKESLKNDLKELELNNDYPENVIYAFNHYTASTVLYGAFFDWRIS